MSDWKARTIECDQCGAEWTLSEVSRRQLRRRAQLDGWWLGRGRIADLCPDCRLLDVVFA